MPALDLRGPLDACTLVDDLGPASTGELSILGADGRRGTVFVEGGRVCWAAARGFSRRLTEILCARAAVAPSAMEATYRSCKERGVALGEDLVARGVLGAHDFREALLEHTIESLGHLCAADARAAWSARAGAGYSPRFTFAPAELAVRACALRHAVIAAVMAPMLAATFDDGDWATAFVRSGASAIPEPVAVHGESLRGTARLLALGRWAASALDVVGAFASDGPLVWVVRRAPPLATAAADRAAPARGPAPPRDNSHLVAFHHEGAVVVGETGVHGPARILNRRAQRRRTGGSGDAVL